MIMMIIIMIMMMIILVIIIMIMIMILLVRQQSTIEDVCSYAAGKTQQQAKSCN